MCSSVYVCVCVSTAHFHEWKNEWMNVGERPSMYMCISFELTCCFALLVYCSIDIVSWPQQNNLIRGQISRVWFLSQTYSNKTWLAWYVWDIPCSLFFGRYLFCPEISVEFIREKGLQIENWWAKSKHSECFKRTPNFLWNIFVENCELHLIVSNKFE